MPPASIPSSIKQETPSLFSIPEHGRGQIACADSAPAIESQDQGLERNTGKLVPPIWQNQTRIVRNRPGKLVQVNYLKLSCGRQLEGPHLPRRYVVSDASVRDSQKFEGVLDTSNTASAVLLFAWALEPKRTEAFVERLPYSNYLLKALAKLDLVLPGRELREP